MGLVSFPGPAVLTLVPLALYVAAAVLLAREAKARVEARFAPSYFVALAGFAAHAWILFSAIRSETGGFSLAITDSASLVGFVVAGSALAAMTSQRLAAMPAPLFVLSGLLAVGTGLVTGFREIHGPTQWEITAHITMAALAAGWLAAAAILVVLLTWQDQRIRARQPVAALAWLPPMETVETWVFRALFGGFTVLTLALVTGFFFVYDPSEQRLVHKIALAVVAWTIFGVLLYGRWRYGWRGRKALRFTVGGFTVLALAYFGSKFVLEVILGQHWG